MNKEMLFFTNIQKVLWFLLANPGVDFYDREISNRAKVGRTGTNAALRQLHAAGMVMRKPGRKLVYYSISTDDALVRQLKVTQNILFVENLVRQMKSCASQIVLYGSAAEGTNTLLSDFDMFVIAQDPRAANDIVMKSPLRERLHVRVETRASAIALRAHNKVFYQQVQKGIVLWQQQ